MPELPEVETIKRDLEKELVGQKLRDIKIFNHSYLLKNKIRNLNSLLGTKLLYIKRKGKYLIFFFQKELLLFHLGLTGFFILSEIALNSRTPITNTCRVVISDIILTNLGKWRPQKLIMQTFECLFFILFHLFKSKNEVTSIFVRSASCGMITLYN